MVTVTEIKSRYPNPVESSGVPNTKDYCVGGAFCLYKGKTSNFPGGYTLACDLRKENQSLSLEEAETFAREIIECNDAGMFTAAWTALDKALTQKESL
jgi:hypothetical protein